MNNCTTEMCYAMNVIMTMVISQVHDHDIATGIMQNKEIPNICFPRVVFSKLLFIITVLLANINSINACMHDSPSRKLNNGCLNFNIIITIK